MTGEKHKQDFALQKLTEYLARTCRSNTPERLEILEAARTLTSGFSVEELASAVEARGVRVSLATVYNAVELFVAAGILARYFGSPGRPLRNAAGQPSSPRMPQLRQNQICKGPVVFRSAPRAPLLGVHRFLF